ncbi:2-(R)-hydroxypropyl-CoM dehydrogenase [Roseovarius sp. THAF9]|uniref:SDR family oxidoreductase n=1 Tax=Roseovarius sp. THAF9 TaxID=2587847 RepID=UPI001268B74A|nr:SDR family oxidoreductase [Roseovarius sp. THAF9]QFT94743.1 2-(R)-hydroxypropyl-CoM dehydrogenase [Roseovarius sp. THAF9]
MTEAVTALRDGVAVVTGASRGLGLELVKAFLDRGMRVAGIVRSTDALSGLASESDGRFLPVTANIADPEQVEAAFARIKNELGPVTILINNAAVYPRRDILDETPDSFMDTVNVNLGGSFSACHNVLPLMMDLGFGRVINVVTFADQAPIPFAAAYSVSKGAQRVLTKALVAELGDRFPNIVFTDWVPGALQTDMGLPDGLPPEKAAQWGVTLALLDERDLQGAFFVENAQVLPPRSKKERVVQALLGQKPVARSLD